MTYWQDNTTLPSALYTAIRDEGMHDSSDPYGYINGDPLVVALEDGDVELIPWWNITEYSTHQNSSNEVIAVKYHIDLYFTLYYPSVGYNEPTLPDGLVLRNITCKNLASENVEIWNYDSTELTEDTVKWTLTFPSSYEAASNHPDNWFFFSDIYHLSTGWIPTTSVVDSTVRYDLATLTIGFWNASSNTGPFTEYHRPNFDIQPLMYGTVETPFARYTGSNINVGGAGITLNTTQSIIDSAAPSITYSDISAVVGETISTVPTEVGLSAPGSNHYELDTGYSLPAGLTLDPGFGEIWGTPTEAFDGDIVIKCTFGS